MKSLLRLPGGKRYLAKFIINQFSKNYEHKIYIEPFVGTGAVLFHKNPSKREIIADLDTKITNAFVCAKNKTFIEELKKIEYSKETFEFYQKLEPQNNFEKGLQEIVLRRMSRGSMKNDFSWSSRNRGNRPEGINSFENFKQELEKISQRLQNVEILNCSALELLDEYQKNNEVLWYLDPPYLTSTRTTDKLYDFEMSEKDHIILAEKLNKCLGDIFLSGYYSLLYAKLYNGWDVTTKTLSNHASQRKIKQKRVECLWNNLC